MNFLKGRNNFMFDRIDESMLYFSPNMRLKLKNIDNEIAKELLDSELTDVKPDITFVDLTDKEGFVSFTQINKADKLVSDKHLSLNVKDGTFMDDRKITQSQINILYNHDVTNDGATGVFTKGRNQVKIGKLVNKIFPGKFKDQDIEKFVNMFKSVSGDGDSDKFELVSGDDIAYWYDCSHYHDDVGGSLGSSCMSSMRDSTFRIYTNNPEVCRMLILKDEESDTIVGRALVWKVYIRNESVKFEYFMDRVYASSDSDIYKFLDFAKEQGWAHKTKQNYQSHKLVTYKDEEYSMVMSVQLNPWNVNYNDYEYEEYPYMDTFAEYDVDDGVLYNNNDRDHGGYLLNGTGGTDHEGAGHWSSYYQELIPDRDAVYSDVLDDYIWEYRAVEVREGWYPIDHDDIFEYDHTWYHRDDGVYSEYEGKYILLDGAVNILTGVDDDGEITNEDDFWINNDESNFASYEYVDFHDLSNYEWFQEMDREYDWTDKYSGISKEYLLKDYNDDWIFKPHAIETFKTKSGEWLKEEEILPLGEEEDYDDTDTRIESDIDYFERVWRKSGRNPYKVLKDVRSEITRLRSIKDGDQSQLDLDDKPDYIKKVKAKHYQLISFFGDFRRYLDHKYDDDPSELVEDRIESMFGKKPSIEQLKYRMFNIRKEFINLWVGKTQSDKLLNTSKFEEVYKYYKDGVKFKSNNYTKEDFQDSIILNYLYIFPAIRSGELKISRDSFISFIEEKFNRKVEDFGREVSIGYLCIKNHNDLYPPKYNTSNIDNTLYNFENYGVMEDYINKKVKDEKNLPEFK